MVEYQLLSVFKFQLPNQVNAPTKGTFKIAYAAHRCLVLLVSYETRKYLLSFLAMPLTTTIHFFPTNLVFNSVFNMS